MASIYFTDTELKLLFEDLNALQEGNDMYREDDLYKQTGSRGDYRKTLDSIESKIRLEIKRRRHAEEMKQALRKQDEAIRKDNHRLDAVFANDRPKWDRLRGENYRANNKAG